MSLEGGRPEEGVSLDLPDNPSRDQLVEVSQRTGIPLSDLKVIESDPFFTGTDAEWRDANWAAENFYALDLVGEHKRGVHYAFISHGILLPEGRLYGEVTPDDKTGERDFTRLCNAISFARDLGLIGIGEFSDRKTVTEVDNGRYGYEPDPVLHPAGFFMPTITDAEYAEPWVEIEPPTPLELQGCRVDLLTEKSGVLDDLVPPARRFGASVLVPRGHSGEVLAEALFEDTKRDGRERIILWVSDADSSGEGMAIATARHLQWLHANDPDCPRILLDRICLTLDQVTEIEAETGREIPRAPDVRREEGRVELDALKFFAPGWLRRRVTERLADLYDASVDTNVTSLVEALEEEVADEERDERATALQDEINEFLASPEMLAAKRKLEEFGQRWLEIEDERGLGEFDGEPDLKDYAPDIGGFDLGGRDWILDTDRSFIEQTNALIRNLPEHLRRPELVLTERGCAVCGGSMAGRPVQARYCSDECRWSAADRRRGRHAIRPERACEGCGKTYSPRRSDQRTCGALACKRKVRSADEAARRAAAGGVAAPEGPRRKNPACREDAGS